MIDIVKDYSLSAILKKLLFLYVLNVLDIIFTLILQSTGCFIEANPVMAFFIENTFSALAIKIVLPAALFILLYSRFKKATAVQLKKSNILVTGLVFIYACINILHMICLSIYFIYAT